MDKNVLLELTESFRNHVSTIIKINKQQMEKQLREYGEEITAHQYAILVRLSKKSLTVKELGEIFSIEPPTLIPIIDSLERRNLLVRVQDMEDRRRKKLQVTPKGIELIKHIRSNVEKDILAKAFLALGEEKSRTFIRLLKEVADELQKY
jgi:DNA-binding MarR family transcriptional regulator